MVEKSKYEEVVKEVSTAWEANDLYASGLFSKPRYSERRDCYVLVRLEEKNQRVKR